MSNDSEIEFVDGLIVKAPREGAPDFVKGSLSIKREELIAWLQSRDGEWVNVDIKEAKSGKWYGAVDNWKPKDKGQDSPRGGGPARPAPNSGPVGGDNPFPDDDIPFATNRGNF